MPSRASRVFLLLLALYTGALISVSLARFYGLMSQGLDLGVFDQLMWSITHRGAPLSTLNPPYSELHWLGFHFSPILFLLAPIYIVAPHPETLLALNVILMVSAAIPVYLIARHWRVPPLLAGLWSAVLLVNPFLLSATVWDFHEAAIATSVMGFALYAVATRNFRLLIAMSVLLLLTKEHYGLSVAGLGLLWALTTDRKQGLMLSALGIAALFFIIFLIMPLFQTGAALPETLQYRFGWLMHPFEQNTHFFLKLIITGIGYAALLLLPFWFLPLYALPWLLPGLSDLAANMLAADDMMHSIYSYHSASLVPVLVVAALRTALFMVEKRPRLRLIEVTVLVALASAGLGYANAPAPLPGAANLWETDLRALDKPYHGDIESIKDMLGSRSLSAQDNVASFFSQRAAIYDFPGGIDKAGAIVLHLYYPLTRSRSLFGAPLNMNASMFTATVSGLLKNPDWRITYWKNGWLVLEKTMPAIAVDKSEIEKALAAMRADYDRAGEKP